MVTTLVHADAVVLEHAVAVGARVLVRDGVIAQVGFEPGAADHALRVDGWLLPGLIDLQVNGAGGHAVEEATPRALDGVARAVADGGASAWLPTLITAPFDVLLDQVAAVAGWIEARGDGDGDGDGGAVPLGIHLEGPFLDAPGAHDEVCFVDPTAARIDALLVASRRRLALVTLSPGRTGAAAAVARLRRAGVAVALGHARSADGLAECAAAGAGLVTHLFNAMGAMHHRNPGMAGLALDDERLACALIPDGTHVHEAWVRVAFRCLGPERSVLVTDSVAAAGMPDGTYRLGGREVRLRDGVVRDARGRLAGSALTMASAARSWMRMVPAAGPWTLARVAAANPARLLGRSDLGRIAPGAKACFAQLVGDTLRRVTRSP